MSRSTSKMDGSKMLSGSQLVAKVATKKVDGQLPEVGLKDTTPNGSWLEQKQIQSVLEARKHLIAVERIEKSGSLSHAVWRDDLKLAEVTKHVGGHWQYIGHKKGKHLYLLPEEALFLVETNSLLLKHNDVTVSLQKAYALCLNKMSIIQYKVYASLSRLGYRVFRHKEPIPDISNGLEAMEENTEIIDTSVEVDPKIDQSVSMSTEKSDSETHSTVNNDDNNTEVIESSLVTIKDTTENLTNNVIPNNVPESNEAESATTKAISVNVEESTTMHNNINTEKDTDIILDQNTIIPNNETSEQDKGKPMPTTKVVIVNDETSVQYKEKPMPTTEVVIVNDETSVQDKDKPMPAIEIVIINDETSEQDKEKPMPTTEVVIVNDETSEQDKEKPMPTTEVVIVNDETSVQDEDELMPTTEGIIVNDETSVQDEDEPMPTTEVVIVNDETSVQDKDKPMPTTEVVIVNDETSVQDKDKPMPAIEVVIVNDETSVQDEDEPMPTTEVVIVNDETSEQDKEKPLPTTEITNEKQDKDKTALTTEGTNNENTTNESVTVTIMDIDDNANETIVTRNGTEDSTPTDLVENANDEETPNTTTLAAVYSIDEIGVIRTFEKDAPMETDSTEPNVASAEVHSTNGDPKSTDSSTNDSHNRYRVKVKHYDDKINKLKERKSNAIRKKSRAMDTMQDFFKQQIVNVNVPEEKYLPRNIFLHKMVYTLNMDIVRNQNASNVPNDETDSLGSSSTQGNDINSQRLVDSPRYSNYNNTQPRYPIYHHQRPYNPRANINNNNLVRQHDMMYNLNMPGANNYNNQPSRNDTVMKYHYDMIVTIAMRLKNHLASASQIRALKKLLNTYNSRYDTQIRMTSDFNIVGTPDSAQNRQVVQLNNNTVIDLDDEPKRKKPRLNDNDARYKNNVERLKELARKLKDLHAKNLAVSRHRRIFSYAIKTFNSKFNADLYLDSGFEIVDRKTVVVDTSSDSDAVVVKETEKPKKRKKLRNPYSILKCLAKDVNVGASTSKQGQEVPVLRKLSRNVVNGSTSQHTNNSNTDSIVADDRDEDLLNFFYMSRFVINDFGGAKLCSKVNARLDALLFQTEYLYDVLKESPEEFESWVDIKLAIWKDIRGTLNLQKQQVEAMSNDLYTTDLETQPILGPDCTDIRSALEQLAIIPTNKEVPDETSLRIHFDVCNRDVHFRKSNPPKPNFRVVCQDESAPFPSPDDVVGLQAKVSDGVPTVFAFVGVSGSISYVQINSIDLPVFIAGIET